MRSAGEHHLAKAPEAAVHARLALTVKSNFALDASAELDGSDPLPDPEGSGPEAEPTGPFSPLAVGGLLGAPLG